MFFFIYSWSYKELESFEVLKFSNVEVLKCSSFRVVNKIRLMIFYVWFRAKISGNFTLYKGLKKFDSALAKKKSKTIVFG